MQKWHLERGRKRRKVISLRAQVAEGQNVSGVCHIFASFNDTFVHVTDLSGKEIICRATGRTKVKAELGITALHIKLQAIGGSRNKTPGPRAQVALRALARPVIKIGQIEDVTPNPSDSTHRKGGRRGYCLCTGLLKYFPLTNCLPVRERERCLAHGEMHLNGEIKG
ncbi:hypothetical protein H8958_011709, partial [Nasalis larvatus]